MEYAIGFNLGKDGGRNCIQMTQCTDPQYNGKVWFNNDPSLKDPSHTAVPYLVKFDPQDQFCQVVPLETLKGV
jgi:hypothetical protein